MICPVCHSGLPDDAKYCGVCGTQLRAEQSQRSTSDQPQIPSDYLMTDPNNAMRNAMSDIKSTPGWIRRIFLLAFMKVLPILNFYATGYELRWATTAWKNTYRSMPKQSFNKYEFLMGLLYMGMGWLVQIGTAWLVICNIIPLAGTIAWIILLFYTMVFSALAALRMASFNRVGAAFDMSEIFKKLRIKSSGLFKAYLLPWVICISIVIAMFMVSFVVTALVGMLFNGASNNVQSDSNFFFLLLTAFTQVIWLYIILAIVTLIASWFLLTLAEVWAFRSLGHWYGYFAFDWICEAEVKRHDDS